MITLKKILIGLFILGIILTCKREEFETLIFSEVFTENVVVTGLNSIRIFAHIDGIQGDLNSNDLYQPRTYGFILSPDDPDPKLEEGHWEIDFQKSFNTNLGFDTTLQDLELNNPFFVRAFVNLGRRSIYGNVLSFDLSTNVGIKLQEEVIITNDQAQFNGLLFLQFQDSIKDYGVVYDKAGNTLPALSQGTILSLGSTNNVGAFSLLANQLDFHTQYEARAFIRTGQDTIYSEPISFATTGGWIKYTILDDKKILEPIYAKWVRSPVENKKTFGV